MAHPHTTGGGLLGSKRAPCVTKSHRKFSDSGEHAASDEEADAGVVVGERTLSMEETDDEVKDEDMLEDKSGALGIVHPAAAITIPPAMATRRTDIFIP